MSDLHYEIQQGEGRWRADTLIDLADLAVERYGEYLKGGEGIKYEALEDAQWRDLNGFEYDRLLALVAQRYAQGLPLGLTTKEWGPGTAPPYSFCLHPEKCAGLTSCPRELSCSE
jgi:hypothetical protein